MGIKLEVLPLVKEISLSLSPAEIFEIFKNEPHGFLLESQIDSEKLGRYSFLGYDPFLVFKSKHREVEVSGEFGSKKFPANPWKILKDLLNSFSLPPRSVFPPFWGGAVGYLSYDMCQLIENLPSLAFDDLDLPHCYFCFYDAVIVFDHFRGKTYLVSVGLPERDATKAQVRAEARLKELETHLSKVDTPRPPSSTQPVTTPAKPILESDFTRKKYQEAVQTVRNYIVAGDVFQVNLSQRFMTSHEVAPFELYKRLRRINPAPFAAYLNFGEVAVVSSSPERFLKLSQNKVQTMPIKGTRPRGKTVERDRMLAQELLNSEKDKAEHIMIVDLERNDLGRVCEYGSIKVTDSVILKTYPTVFHLVSAIEGTLAPGKDRIDLLRACFPGGSITGAPKVRAMEIIEELEPTKRNIYTGSIGYLSFSGQMDLNIAIRTFVLSRGKTYFQVGGGIVFDSDPGAEYTETLDKAKALINALELC